MKKLAIAGIVIFLTMLFVTCDLPGSLGGKNDVGSGKPTYVDYEYDGTSLKLYLDGTKVPYKAPSASRALNRDLAQMTHDYFEVVFVGNSGNSVARAAWEIGQAAGISGVFRDADGVDYGHADAAIGIPSAVDADANGSALIFVGRKADKTLLGIGKLTHVDDVTSTIVTTAARSVTFTVEALTTNIAFNATSVTSPSAANPGGPLRTGASFLTDVKYNGGGNSTYNYISSTSLWTPKSGTPSVDSTHVRFSVIGRRGVIYPIFILPDPSKRYLELGGTDFGTVGGDRVQVNGSNAVQGNLPLPGYSGVIPATYTISGKTMGVAPELWGGMIQTGTIAWAKRSPRYMEGGQYWGIQDNDDTFTDFEVTTHDAGNSVTGLGRGDSVRYDSSSAYKVMGSSPFGNQIGMRFTTNSESTGAFSILFRIPVIALTALPSTNGADNAEDWSIRPGIGGNLYNIDSGFAAGGAALISIGDTSLDWLWIKVTGDVGGL